MRSYPVLQQPLLCADWQAGFCVQDIAGTVSTMHMSPYADCLAIITEEDPSVISIFSWNLSTVIKDLEQFQTSIATGTGLVTVPGLSAELVRLRRIAAPLTLVAGLCLPPTDKFVYLEELSGANQTSRNPSNTETPLQRITSKVQLEALMRKTIRQLERGHVQTSELARVMKEAEITTFAPIIAFTSRSLVEYVGKQSKKQSKGQPACVCVHVYVCGRTHIPECTTCIFS
eukprot:scpid23877/ scgid0896/ 